MTQNAMQIGPELFGVGTAALILFLFALALALPHRRPTLPGSSGHREEGNEDASEIIRPDGYIDSYNRKIEEAGGSLPWVVWLAVVGVLLWWLSYLLLFWKPR
jgi:hypothetical protein